MENEPWYMVLDRSDLSTLHKALETVKTRAVTPKEKQLAQCVRKLCDTLRRTCSELHVAKHESTRLAWGCEYARKAPTLKASKEVLKDILDGSHGAIDVEVVRGEREKLRRKVERTKPLVDAAFFYVASLESEQPSPALMEQAETVLVETVQGLRATKPKTKPVGHEITV